MNCLYTWLDKLCKVNDRLIIRLSRNVFYVDLGLYMKVKTSKSK